MTREELCIYACKYAIGELTRKGSSAFITSAHEGRQQITWVEVMEWLNREQQPEDAISRQDTLKTIIKHLGIRSEEYLLPAEEAIYKVVKNMPPVQPKPRVGHWIYDKRIENWKCSECGCSPKTIGYVGRVEFMREHFKFCNHCGVRMIESQTESGDKE